ncbi:hypothetical protein [Arcobacter arenosus]|uniref:Uncharacterized protein n=1 Tax=Arcobacter arenosus TaxID=2576037 RepID=A0A5R8Y5V1_9BACT|nr:hypothetical protein [Arcobacter arenosus]TLP41043.1 hypothetical protein FDK22_03215 [Arcobacter arenosus]
MKVKFLTSLVGKDINYQTGKEETINDNEAFRLIKNEIAVPLGDAAEKKYKSMLAAEKKELEAEKEKEKALEKALFEDDLKAEKAELEKRIAEIDDILGIKEK